MILPHNPNAFARSPLDRAAHRRRDEVWLKAAMEDDTQTSMVVFDGLKPLLFESGGQLFLRPIASHTHASMGRPDSPLLFLGVDQYGGNYFAYQIADPTALADMGEFMELRAAGPRLEADRLPIIGCARSIFEWHDNNRFCARCGAASEAAEAGWKRVCPACQREHFPRVDPVVIMLAAYGDKCLLGRQRAWPPGMFSALAGFVEPGETMEEAVARETLEEAGIVVREVRLHSMQPWPFPHSLMMGAIAEAVGDEIRIDETELETARWFTREEARQLIAGKHESCFAPPPFAIAHQLLKTWSES